jgi:Tfp pilus assembly protein PilF
MNNLGNLHCEKHQPDRAEQMYHQALLGMEKALGPDHTFALGIVNNLGVLCADRGLLVESKQMYRRALDGLQPRLSSDHPITGMIIENLERLQKEVGKDQTTSVSKGTGHQPRRRWYFG